MSFTSATVLHEIGAYLHLLPDPSAVGPPQLSAAFLLRLLVSHHKRRPSQIEALNDTPLYPTEQLLWDENVVPSEFYNGDSESFPVVS